MPSSNEIEREVEDRRAHVESTLDALKAKMSVGQIVDEFGGFVGAEDAKLALGNVGRQVRDNPVALGLVGVGLAWLMLGGGGGRSGRRHDPYDRDWPGRGRSGAGASGGYAPGAAGGTRYGSAYGTPYATGDAAAESEGMLSRAGHAVGDTVHAVRDRLSDAGESASHALSDAGRRLRSAGDDGRSRMRAMRDHAGARPPSDRGMVEQVADAIERQPLMAGAFAIAAGVAIGAALPATRMEDRWIGDERDTLVGAARDAARDIGGQAADAARAGLRAASDTARDEGLTPARDGKTFAAKVETAVKAGVDETRRSLDPERAGTTGASNA